MSAAPAEHEAAALENLQKIKHIVVLMMENRSFDHMLGYLKKDEIPMPDVDGLDRDRVEPRRERRPCYRLRVPARTDGIPPARQAVGRQPRPVARLDGHR